MNSNSNSENEGNKPRLLLRPKDKSWDRTKDVSKVQKMRKSSSFVSIVATFHQKHTVECCDKFNLIWNGTYLEHVSDLNLEAIIQVYTPRDQVKAVELMKKMVVRDRYTKDLETTIYGAHKNLIDKDGKPWYVVNLKSGVIIIDPETGDARYVKHTLDHINYRFTSCLPIVYDPKATCPKTEQFMREVLPEEDVRVNLLFGAYILVPNRSLQQAPFWYGTGKNGKQCFSYCERQNGGTKISEKG